MLNRVSAVVRADDPRLLLDGSTYPGETLALRIQLMSARLITSYGCRLLGDDTVGLHSAPIGVRRRSARPPAPGCILAHCVLRNPSPRRSITLKPAVKK